MEQYINYKHFYNPTMFAEKYLMVCDGMGYEGNPNFLIDREYFNNQLVMYVIEGELYVEQYDKKFTVVSGEGIFLDLRDRHKYYFNKKMDTAIIWFHLRGMPLEKLIEHIHRQRKLPLMVKQKKLKEKIYELFELTKNVDGQFEYQMSSRIYSLVLHLMEECLKTISEENEQGNLWRYDVERYIQRSISEKFELGEIAKVFNMSKYHFCRKFKEEFRMTLFEYIRQEKIGIAKKMLLSTNDSIADIASYLNYCDQGYFATTFREVVGCTPKKYKLKS